jgi:hypothetical protein
MAAAAASPRLQSAPGVADRLATEFQDLDDDSCFYRSLERLRDEKTRNFVVRYNASEAKVAFDLEAMQFDSVLAAQVCSTLPFDSPFCFTVYPARRSGANKVADMNL